MYVFKNNNIFVNLILVILFLFFNSCSEKEEHSDFEKLGATSSGSGTIEGTVENYSNNSGLSGVSISFSLSGTSKATNSTDSNGDYSQSSLPLGTYTISYSKSGYISSTQSGTLGTDNQTLSAAKITMLPTSCGSGYITGKIKDAVNGDNMGSVTLSARSGINVTSGTVLGTATSADNGTYSLGSLDAGLYTVQTSVDGYISSTFNVRLCGGASNQNANLSKTLRDNQMRIVLSWEGVEDFDSHLEIPCSPPGTSTKYSNDNCTGSNKNDESHLYYGTTQDNPPVTYDGVSTRDYHIYTDWVDDGTDNVTLDQDNFHGTCTAENEAAGTCDPDRTGPETITINKLRDGSYRYHVHAYTQAVDRGTTNTRHLTDNSTSVQFCYNEWIEAGKWGDGCLTLTPINEGGNLWTVFDFWCIINQNTHKPSCVPHFPNIQNKMLNEANPANVDDH